jgi:hypothetical protein
MLEDGTPIRAMTIRMGRRSRKEVLREWLLDPDEVALARMWQAIESRFPRRRRRPSHFLALVPAVVVAASIATAAYMRHDPTPLPPLDGKAIAAGGNLRPARAWRRSTRQPTRGPRAHPTTRNES